MLRVAVVDDEPLARRALRTMIGDEPGVTCVGEARTGTGAVALLDRERPDAVFLDVEMPGASGLDVLRRVERVPLVVFTTAYDRYAVAAFDLEAVDFLLKPFGRRRFRQAMVRLRAAEATASATTPTRPWLQRLFVLRQRQLIPLAVESIESFQGAGDYVTVRAGAAEHLVSRRLKQLEQRLDPERFVRIHRSWIVNLDHVRAIESESQGSLVVAMRDGTRHAVSRRRASELRRRMRGSAVGLSRVRPSRSGG